MTPIKISHVKISRDFTNRLILILLRVHITKEVLSNHLSGPVDFPIPDLDAVWTSSKEIQLEQILVEYSYFVRIIEQQISLAIWDGAFECYAYNVYQVFNHFKKAQI